MLTANGIDTHANGQSEIRMAGKGSRHYLICAFLFSVFVNMLMLTGPLFMLQVYGRVLSSRSEETLVALLILVTGLYAMMWMLDFVRARLVARFGARLQSDLDERVFCAQLSSSAGDLKEEKTNAARDLEAIQAFYVSPVFLAMMDAPFTPLFIGAIFIFQPFLGGFALAGSIALITVTMLNRFLTSHRVAHAQAASDLANQFSENAKNASELIRCQGMLEPVSKRWLEYRQNALAQNMSAVDWTSVFSTFTKALRLSLQSFILALGAWLMLRAELTAGAMIAASVLLGRALAPIDQVLGRWPQVTRARQGHRSLGTFLSRIPVPVSRTRLPRPAGGLDVKGVTIAAGPGAPPLLYNVTFNIAPGQALGVIGRSGSGKTTIAKTILGLAIPNVGEIRLGGALLQH